MGGNVELEWNNKRFNNYLDLWKSQNTQIVVYKLQTPKFENKKTFVMNLEYTPLEGYHNVT